REARRSPRLCGGIAGHWVRRRPPGTTIMAAVSQWERDAIGERTRVGLRHKRGKGERVGNIEFGFQLGADGKHLEAHPAEQAALSGIHELRRGGHTLRGIAAALNGEGHRTRRGTEWRLESVVRVLKRDASAAIA